MQNETYQRSNGHCSKISLHPYLRLQRLSVSKYHALLINQFKRRQG